MRKKTLILIPLMLACLTLYGQEVGKGTSMINFLKIGVGSRATAMGDAFVGIANDASALYWNPGGVGFMKKKELFAQTNKWIVDSYLNFAGLVIPIKGVGSFGASIYSFSSGEMEETTLDSPEGTGRAFSANDLALGVSYARQLSDRFSAGIAFKVITESLMRESASSFAVDVGSIFITNFLNNMRIGFSFSNFGANTLFSGADMIVYHDVAPDLPTNQPVEASLVSRNWELPLTFRVGIATNLIETDDIKITQAIAANDSRDYTPRYNFGTEFSLKDRIFIRGGYKADYSEGGLTFGVGLNLEMAGYSFIFDYSSIDQGVFGYVSLYSVSVRF